MQGWRRLLLKLHRGCTSHTYKAAASLERSFEGGFRRFRAAFGCLPGGTKVHSVEHEEVCPENLGTLPLFIYRTAAWPY